MTDPSAAGRWLRPGIRAGALLVALVTIVVGAVGLASPDRLTAFRQATLESPARLCLAATVRVAMGLLVIAAATGARIPALMRVLGGLMIAQRLSAMVLGTEHARTVLAWESSRPEALRAGAVVALASGLFMVIALIGRRRRGTLP